MDQKDKLEHFFQLCQQGKTQEILQIVEGTDPFWKKVNEKKYNSLQHSIQYKNTDVVKILLEKGMNPNDFSGESTSPIFIALEVDSIEILKLLLSFDANPNFRMNGMTPVSKALELGRKECFEYLLNYPKTDIFKLDIRLNNFLHKAIFYKKTEEMELLLRKSTFGFDKANSDGLFPVHICAQKGDLEAMKVLELYMFSFDKLTNSKRTPLHYAIESGNIEVVKFLLDKKVSVNAPDIDQITPLYIAQEIANLEMIKILSQYGAKSKIHSLVSLNEYDKVVEYLNKFPKCVNFMDFGQRTPIHYSAMEGFQEMTELLVNKGAEINLSAQDEMTPFLLAVRNGHDDISKYLLLKGANIDKVDGNQNTALHLAVLSQYPETVTTLLGWGINPNLQNSKGETPFHLLIRSDIYNLFPNFLEKGVNLLLVTKKKQNILHWISKFNRIEIIQKVVEIFKEKGFNINEPDVKKKTPLTIAVNKTRLGIVKILVENGADVNFRDEHNFTPLHAAIKNKDMAIIRFLLENKADPFVEINNENIWQFIIKNEEKKEILEVFLPFKKDLMEIDSTGQNLIHIAASLNKVGFVDLLLSVEKQLGNLKDAKGQTVIHLFAMNNSVEGLKTCTKYEVDINAQDKNCKRGVHIVSEKGYLESMNFFISQGANLDSADSTGESPISYAGFNRHENIMELLISQNIESPLLTHLMNDEIPQVEDMLSKGFFVDCLGVCGDNALHLAIKKQMDLRIITLICDNTVDLDRENKDHLNAIQLAATSGNKDICSLLLDRGVRLTNYPKMDLHPHIIAQKQSDPPSECFNMLAIEFKRTMSVFEILETEKNYVNVLNVAVEYIYRPMLTKQLILGSDITTIFGNIYIICESNKNFLNDLTERLKKWNKNQTIGDIAKKHFQFLYHYRSYTSNADKSLATRKKYQNNPRFTDFVNQAISKSTIHSDLDTILSKPINRVGQYSLLLKEVLKRTPKDHPDYPLVEEALALFEEMTKKVNENKRITEKREEVESIEQTIDRLPFKLSESKSRMLLKQGKVQSLNIFTSAFAQDPKKSINSIMTQSGNIKKHSAFPSLKMKKKRPLKGKKQRITKKKSKAKHELKNLRKTVIMTKFPSYLALKNTHKYDMHFRLGIDPPTAINEPEVKKTRKTTGSVKSTVKQKYIFLFNDLLLICQSKKEKEYIFEFAIPTISLFAFKTLTGEIDQSKVLHLVTYEGPFIFFVESQEERDDWFLKIEESIETIQSYYYSTADSQVKQIEYDLGKKGNVDYDTWQDLSKSRINDYPSDFVSKPQKVQKHSQTENFDKSVFNSDVPSLYRCVCYYIKSESEFVSKVKFNTFYALSKDFGEIQENLFNRLENKKNVNPKKETVRMLFTLITEANTEFLIENDFYR